MLNINTKNLVKATVPVLKEHGVALTRHFYARMFSHNPELKSVFNQGKAIWQPATSFGNGGIGVCRTH